MSLREIILSLTALNFWPVLGLVRSNLQTRRLRRLKQWTFAPSGALPVRQDGPPEIALGSLQDHLSPPMPHRRTLGVRYPAGFSSIPHFRKREPHGEASIRMVVAGTDLNVAPNTQEHESICLIESQTLL